MRSFLILVATLFALPAVAQDVRIVVRSPAGASAGCGTCIGVRDGKSLILTCDHMFMDAAGPERTTVTEAGKPYPATVLHRDRAADTALLVVDAVLPVAALADTDATPGDAVRHNGKTSGPARGIVLPKPTAYTEACMHFASTLTAISGDSGSAVYGADGKVVALLCGRFDQPETSPMRGTPASVVRGIVATHAPGFTGGVVAPASPPPAERWETVEQVVARGDGTTFTRIVVRRAK